MTFLEAHYRKNFQRLVNKYKSFLGYHHAEDVVQETYTQMLELMVGDEEFLETFERVAAAVVQRMSRDIRAKGTVRENSEETSPEEIDEDLVWLKVAIHKFTTDETDRKVLVDYLINGYNTYNLSSIHVVDSRRIKHLVNKFLNHYEDSNV